MNTADQSKISAPVRLNSCGGQYIQPKVKENLDFSKPTYGKKPLHESQSNVVKNSIQNLNRSNTITHQRIADHEIKRKQSLPAQGSDYFDKEFDRSDQPDACKHNYLPFGALKKSKSAHTLALLQQFEAKGKPSGDTPPPSYVKRPEPEPKPKPIIKKASSAENTKPAMQQTAISPPQSSKSISPNVLASPRTSTQSTPVHVKSPLQNASNRSKSPPPENLSLPEITETPSSPLVQDGHIIFPGQTSETRRRVQRYAQTLNAIHNRKSIVLDDDDDDAVDNDAGKGLQRSKSGTLLCVPKQYESAIRKSELLEKERTVAAYFAGNKSPQSGVQHSSSQHSMHSSSSVKTAEGQKSTTVSPMQNSEQRDVNAMRDLQEISSHSRTTTTTTKSAHHLKILRRQQKQTSPNPLSKSHTAPSINLLDESNVDDAIDDLFASFGK